MEHPRVLIVQTTPYSTNASSRSLDSYFHFWEKDRVRQIFSRNWKPQKGHCGELFQITDSDLVKCWLRREKNIGNVYHYEELDDQGKSQVMEDNDLVSKSYKLGRKHTPTIELLRSLLWRKKYWCSEKLLSWLDEYKPELVFYNFTNNLFLPRIALFVSERYDIPIVTAIGDDYYFNDRHSLSPAYHLFRRKYKRLTKQVFQRKGSAVYVCDKIRDKYNETFNLAGETVYFNSSIERKEFKPINTEDPQIAYFGNIRLGRNKALISIADALGQIDSKYQLKVYSNETDEQIYRELKQHSNIFWGGSIPYSEVMNQMRTCDIYVIAEGFGEEEINYTRYSLSTKAADGLASGCSIFAYGPKESGLIDYMIKSDAAIVCCDDLCLKEQLSKLFFDVELQKKLYNNSRAITQKNHTVESSTIRFQTIAYSLSKRPIIVENDTANMEI